MFVLTQVPRVKGSQLLGMTSDFLLEPGIVFSRTASGQAASACLYAAVLESLCSQGHGIVEVEKGSIRSENQAWGVNCG